MDSDTRCPDCYKDLRAKWIRSSEPRKVISDGDTETTAVINDTNLSVRIYQSNDISKSKTSEWMFKVETDETRYLKHVCLALDDFRENFTLDFVDHNDWHVVSKDISDDLQCCNLKRQEIDAPYPKLPKLPLYYTLKVNFETKCAGTYKQDIIFIFNKGPALRRQLCVDVVPIEEKHRLEAADNYLKCLNIQNLMPRRSIVPFSSAYLTQNEIQENKLGNEYCEPDIDTMLLTYCTLSETLNAKNYRTILHELIALEEIARVEQIARYNKSLIDVKIMFSYTLTLDTDSSSVAKFPAHGELFAEIPLDREITEELKSGRLLLRSCNFILVRKDLKDNCFYEAYIEDKCNQMIYARLSKDCVEQLKLEDDMCVKMCINFILNRISFCEWHWSIDILPDTKLIFPEPNMKLPIALEWSEDWAPTLEGYTLNTQQKKAVAAIMAPRSVILPPVLILGPFGTGKTSTIAQALKILLVNDPKSKVLLCTHSNSAADLYVKEFFHNWYTSTNNERFKPLRIYYTGRMKTTVHKDVQKYCLLERNDRFRNPYDFELAEYGLVITTLATSSSLLSLDFKPTHIIVDEAAQALECEVLTCLSLASPDTRLVLAGDQMQLAPEVYSDLAKERGLDVSLLERIHKIYEPSHPCRIQLCVNYRAHARIVNLISELFYKNEIVPGLLLNSHPEYAPLTFYACGGSSTQGNISTGFYNPIEASILADKVLALRMNWPREWGEFNESSVGVVAHYKEQVHQIRLELRKRKLYQISVERVLNIQGKQFTALFISIVHMGNGKHSINKKMSDYGFLTDPKLLNTAITRAKRMVAVVGDPTAMVTIGSCTEHWRMFLRSAKIYGIDQCIFEIHMNEKPEMPKGPPLNPLAEEFVPRNNCPSLVPPHAALLHLSMNSLL